MLRLSLIAGAIAVAVGCGGTNTYHCDFNNSEDPEPRCQERSNDLPGGGQVTAETYKETCEVAQGDGGDGPCPVAGQVAGCDYGQSGAETAVDWYYEPKTLADVEADCEGEGEVIMP